MVVTPRISIVTPSYNQAMYLEECIDSVLSQGYPNLEYVIIDGGSTDGSREIIQKYAKYLTYWQSSPDNGQYAAINTGFSHTTGDIMAWLNSDDRYHPNAFLKIACAFSEYPEVTWLTGRATVFQEDGQIKSIDKYFPQFSRKKILSGHIDKPFIMQEATFWKRSLWNRAGAGLDTQYHLAADTELWIRFFRTDQLYLLDALLAGFRQQNNNRSVQNIEKYHAEARIAISQELATVQKNEQFNPPPKPLEITTKSYLDFSETFRIPRFKPTEHRLWKTYLKTVTDWILNRRGGLESAPIFFTEIALWQDSEEWDTRHIQNYLRQCLEFKQQAEELIMSGEKHFNNNRLDEALQTTFNALEIWPTSADGNNNLAVMLYSKKKINEAIESLVLVTQHDASKSEAYRNLALIFHELGLRDKIQWALGYYLAYFPDDTEMEQFYRRLMECH